MADNQELSSFGNFSIENTMEMGMGNSELLNDLMAPETAASSPDDVTEIVKEEPVTPKKSSNKTAAPAAETDAEEKSEKEDTSKSIQDFLLGGDDEEEEEEDSAPVAKSKKATDAVEDDNEEEELPSQFAALSNDLFKLGVFNKEEDDEDSAISTPEEFLERFNLEKKKGAIDIVENFIGQFGEDYKQAFDAIFVKGVDPKDYFSAYNNIQSFADLDLSQESNQVAVIKQALADQGFEPEDIDTEVERLKNYGDLESVSGKHHKVLIKKESAKLAKLEETKQVELQKQQAYKQQYYQNVQAVLQDKLKAKEFDGIPLNPKLANELQDFLLVDKYQTSSGEKLTEFDRQILELKRPENHELKVKVGLLMKILETDPTLSTIQKRGISKKSDDLFSEVARQTSKSAIKSKQASSKSTSWFQ
jgi:hypothetical protein